MTVDAAVALVMGVLFSIGLGVSGMTDPRKVQAFLDIAGEWDPTLALVMGSAVVASSIVFKTAAWRETPVFASDFDLPKAARIDTRLILGSALFGIGWGIAGYCPGPALASLFGGGWRTLVFVGFMMIGLKLGNRVRAASNTNSGQRERGDG